VRWRQGRKFVSAEHMQELMKQAQLSSSIYQHGMVAMVVEDAFDGTL
jgi:hypothetical protein